MFKIIQTLRNWLLLGKVTYFNQTTMILDSMQNINMDLAKKEEKDDTPVPGFFLYEEEEIQEDLEPTINIF